MGNMTDDTVPVKRRAGRSAQREERRSQLVDSAIRAIMRRGPDVAMEDIASEAGVSKPILYRHFQDKADLYMAISARAAERMTAALLPSLSAQQEPRELLHTAIDTYLAFIEREPDLYRFVVRRSFADRPVADDPVTTNTALIAGTIAGIFGDQLRALGMDSGGAETWAYAGVGMVQAAGDWWLERRSLSREALRDYLVMLAWGSMEAILAAGGSPSRMGTATPTSGGTALRLLPGTTGDG